MQNLVLRVSGSDGSQIIYNPPIAQALELVEQIKDGYGVYTLRDQNKNDVTLSLWLTIESAMGTYLPALCFGSGEVLYYKNEKADDSWIEFAGYDHPTELLTDDFDLIVKMVKDFYEKGTVKELSNRYDFLNSDMV